MPKLILATAFAATTAYATLIRGEASEQPPPPPSWLPPPGEKPPAPPSDLPPPREQPPAPPSLDKKAFHIDSASYAGGVQDWTEEDASTNISQCKPFYDYKNAGMCWVECDCSWYFDANPTDRLEPGEEVESCMQYNQYVCEDSSKGIDYPVDKCWITMSTNRYILGGDCRDILEYYNYDWKEKDWPVSVTPHEFYVDPLEIYSSSEEDTPEQKEDWEQPRQEEVDNCWEPDVDCMAEVPTLGLKLAEGDEVVACTIQEENETKKCFGGKFYDIDTKNWGLYGTLESIQDFLKEPSYDFEIYADWNSNFSYYCQPGFADCPEEPAYNDGWSYGGYY